MIRAIILCCDEQNRRMSVKEAPGPGHTMDASSNTGIAGYNGFDDIEHGQGHRVHQGPGGDTRRPSHDPSLGRSYGDGLNCGYMQER